ncbi:MAG: lytic transglycosylase domain-containing protein [Solirubrobacterales bacterium]
MAATRTTRRGARNRRPARTRPAPGRIWVRRGIAVAIAVLMGAGVAMLMSGKVGNVIKEITLPLRHEDIIRQQAADKGVDASLIAAVIYAESRFRDQTSSAGARGLMQLTPAAANDIERRSGGTTFTVKDLADPQINISYGTYLLSEFLDAYDGNEVAALAAYNAGPGNADAWGGSSLTLDDIRFPETRGYVEEVLDKQQAYRRKYAKELGY